MRRPGVAVVLLTALIGSPTQLAVARQEDAPAAPSHARPVAQVLAVIGRSAGVIVVADSTLAGERVAFPDAPVTPANVEEQIARVVRALPQGARWAKLYLPPPPEGRVWKGDEVMAYALAQARLWGGVIGASGPPGTEEILTQRLPADKARVVIEALNLKPVYLVTGGRGTFQGVWTSTFGEMRLRQVGGRVTGTYTFQDGTIEGRVTGNVLRFWWLERASGGRGAGSLTLAEDGESFAGRWNSGDDPDAGGSEWTGRRVSRSAR